MYKYIIYIYINYYILWYIMHINLSDFELASKCTNRIGTMGGKNWKTASDFRFQSAWHLTKKSDITTWAELKSQISRMQEVIVGHADRFLLFLLTQPWCSFKCCYSRAGPISTKEMSTASTTEDKAWPLLPVAEMPLPRGLVSLSLPLPLKVVITKTVPGAASRAWHWQGIVPSIAEIL